MDRSVENGMKKKSIHIANILVLIILLIFNLAVFWATAGISEGGMNFGAWVLIVSPFVFWGIFYLIQFLRKSNIWRWICFAIMVVFLYFWETGYGALLIRTLGIQT